MIRASKRLAARAAARQRQAEANEDQRQRDHTELEHATEFEVARVRRDNAAATVVAHEIEMARQVNILLRMGNSATRVAGLTGVAESEIRRLRKLADASQDDHASAQRADTGGRRRTDTRPANHTGAVATPATSANPSDQQSNSPADTPLHRPADAPHQLRHDESDRSPSATTNGAESADNVQPGGGGQSDVRRAPTPT